VLERQQFRGNNFEEQAAAIEQITQRYNIGYIAIDTTGMGQGVYQLVCKFFPAAVALNYSPEVKTRLVLKGPSVFRNGRLQFDASWTDLAAAFMAIKQTMTASGRQTTFTAARNDETGHADLAWACLHAIDREPLAGAGVNSFIHGVLFMSVRHFDAPHTSAVAAAASAMHAASARARTIAPLCTSRRTC
jgi:hypothetical protein